MIEKVISYSRTTEVDAIGRQLLAAYADSSLDSDQNLADIMHRIEGHSTKLNGAIRRIKSESELEEKDELRDKAVRGLYYLLQGYTHHPDVVINNAAQKMMDVFEHYGLRIIKESYATESSLIHSLLKDLVKPANVEVIAQLSGAADCISAIQTAQQGFETCHLDYEQDKAEEGTYANASTLKRELVKQVNNQLVVYLKAMSLVNEPTYGDFTRVVAQIIGDSNEIVRKRSKKVEVVDV